MLAIGLATCLPALLAFNVPPSATLLNQACAIVAWGAVALVATPSRPVFPHNRGLFSVVVALVILIAAALLTPVWTNQPSGFALANAGSIVAALVLLSIGAAIAADGRMLPTFRALCWAFILAGTASTAIGVVQVFAPQWCDSVVVACPSSVGRASGNLRQPNHLSSLLLWALIAVVALNGMGVIRRVIATAWGGLLVLGIVLTASRTGIIGVVLLALWGALDRRLDRSTRAGLLLVPVAYAIFWFASTAWAHAGNGSFAGEGRLTGSSDISSSRFAIWSNTLALIGRHPWEGVGFGEFNFAWTLTYFPDRPVAFFDHTHNLPLNLLVEIGIPLAILVLVLLGFALWKAFSAERTGPESVAVRALFMMVLMMVLHSQLEYPLWYSYFLLPTSFAFGLCLADARRVTSTRSVGLRIAAVLVIAGGIATTSDYGRVVAIFAPAENAGPLEQRIERGKQSWFFSHHAHYAAATMAPEPASAIASFDVATHYLLDTRLMIAWSKALAATGEIEKARHLAQRLREFRNDDAQEFFAPCSDRMPAGQPAPFQCSAPDRVLDHRDFRAR